MHTAVIFISFGWFSFEAQDSPSRPRMLFANLDEIGENRPKSAEIGQFSKSAISAENRSLRSRIGYLKFGKIRYLKEKIKVIFVLTIYR
jgi:hypothetical protein